MLDFSSEFWNILDFFSFPAGYQTFYEKMPIMEPIREIQRHAMNASVSTRGHPDLKRNLIQSLEVIATVPIAQRGAGATVSATAPPRVSPVAIEATTEIMIMRGHDPEVGGKGVMTMTSPYLTETKWTGPHLKNTVGGREEEKLMVALMIMRSLIID